MLRTLRLLGSACLVSLAVALPAPELIDDETLQCVSAKNTWESAAYSPEPDTDVSYTTLCDGRPRAVESRYITKYTTYDPPRTVEIPQWLSNIFTPAPTCTIAETACTSLLTSYNSAISHYQTNDAPSPTLKPQCTAYQTCKPGAEDQCRIYGYGGNLYYARSTIFASPTNSPSPNTVVMDGYTFTSPTNYAEFSGLQGFVPTTRGRRVECGGTAAYDIVIVPLTETFSSYAKTGKSSFNFEDLNTIPAAAYEVQRKCWNEEDCTTLSGFYTPMVPLPNEVLNLQPKEWKEAGCAGRVDISGRLAMTSVPLVTPAPTAPAKLVR
ncbi:hypothetical protein Q7P35_006705 [Cladosporium inversicolor]